MTQTALIGFAIKPFTLKLTLRGRYTTTYLAGTDHCINSGTTPRQAHDAVSGLDQDTRDGELDL